MTAQHDPDTYSLLDDDELRETMAVALDLDAGESWLVVATVLMEVVVAHPRVCDSRYDGCSHNVPCGQPNDRMGRGPWCKECNPRRLAHIAAELQEIRGNVNQDWLL